MLNLYDADGKIQFDKDREAAHQYFLQHVNQNTVFFHDEAVDAYYMGYNADTAHKFAVIQCGTHKRV
jgi:hypothetical protein